MNSFYFVSLDLKILQVCQLLRTDYSNLTISKLILDVQSLHYHNGGEQLLEEKLTTSILTLELEKLGNRILEDLESFLVEYDGKQKDIECGTLIRIPLGAGYVSFSTSQIDSSTTLKLWIPEMLTRITTM